MCICVCIFARAKIIIDAERQYRDYRKLNQAHRHFDDTHSYSKYTQMLDNEWIAHLQTDLANKKLHSSHSRFPKIETREIYLFNIFINFQDFIEKLVKNKIYIMFFFISKNLIFNFPFWNIENVNFWFKMGNLSNHLEFKVIWLHWKFNLTNFFVNFCNFFSGSHRFGGFDNKWAFCASICCASLSMEFYYDRLRAFYVFFFLSISLEWRVC